MGSRREDDDDPRNLSRCPEYVLEESTPPGVSSLWLLSIRRLIGIVEMEVGDLWCRCSLMQLDGNLNTMLDPFDTLTVDVTGGCKR